MSPKRREREYARRRYEKWQQKQLARRIKRRRVKRRGAAAGVAAVTVAAIAWGVLTLTASGNPSTAASDSDSCPSPTVTPPAHPKSWAKPPATSLAAGKTWDLTLTTSCGPIDVKLDGAKAPKAVSSMVFLAQQGFLDSTPCHRLTTDKIYVLQCGDPTGSGSGGPGYTYGPVENAPKNGVYPAGTVAMARHPNDGSSMGSQFFLVYKDSPIPSDTAGGYTVLGTITSGLDVVKKVAAGGVTEGSQPGDGAPVRAVSILSTAVKPK